MSEFKYRIDPERVYTLSYDDENGQIEYEVSGKQIIASFRREAFLNKLMSLDNLIDDIAPENIHDDLRW